MSRGLIGRFQDLLGHGLLKSALFGSVPPKRTQDFIAEVGPDLRDAWVRMAEARLEDFLGVHRISVDYDQPDAIAKAVEANGFVGKNVFMGIPVEKIPIVGRGQMEHPVREIHFGKVMWNRNLPGALKARGVELGFKQGFKFADPLTSLWYALKLPERQRKYPLGILFYDTDGELCFLFLDVDDDGRSLYVNRINPDDSWLDDMRFLAVPAEFQPLAA